MSLATEELRKNAGRSRKVPEVQNLSFYVKGLGLVHRNAKYLLLSILVVPNVI